MTLTAGVKERGPSWAATTSTPLIKEGYVTVPGGNPGRTYDISPDGQRFLLIKAEPAATPITLIVVQHFDEELKRLVPTKITVRRGVTPPLSRSGE